MVIVCNTFWLKLRACPFRFPRPPNPIQPKFMRRHGHKIGNHWNPMVARRDLIKWKVGWFMRREPSGDNHVWHQFPKYVDLTTAAQWQAHGYLAMATMGNFHNRMHSHICCSSGDYQSLWGRRVQSRFLDISMSMKLVPPAMFFLC